MGNSIKVKGGGGCKASTTLSREPYTSVFHEVRGKGSQKIKIVADGVHATTDRREYGTGVTQQ